MSDELADYDKELEKIIVEIRKGLDELPKTKEKDRPEKMSYLNSRVKRAKDTLQSFKVEIRELAKLQQEPYMLKAKEYGKQIDQLIQDLRWAEKNDEAGPGGQGKEQLDAMSAEQIVQKGEKIQKQDIDAVDRMVQVTEQTKAVGSATTTKLAENSERLRKTEEGLDEVEANIKLAGKELASFARRVATDKVFLCLACLVVLGIIGVIVYSIVDPNSDTNVPDAFKPTIPGGSSAAVTTISTLFILFSIMLSILL